MATKKSAPAAPKKSAAAAPKAPKAPKEKVEKAPRVKQPESNGISRPKEGTTTGTIWAIADSLSSKGSPATRAQVIEQAAKQDINEATVATQFQRWRQYNGIQRAAPVAKAPKAPKAKKSAPAAPTASV